ncbi:hypothetical protein CDL12_10994 [Handroanthus impetiginosus]|uniref:MADS-box domain-containing protein n=1 Tax=Handroanthus impetiginosus TaxID=429701 RepID=A0A2G9HGE4_9LAMI|nr:hypothetical protein CDL12_10994 [Handroanthus impetiginosus]
MGRRKLEIKRIEDKSAREVTFTKRRNGLLKKAKELLVLCDVDVTAIILSFIIFAALTDLICKINGLEAEKEKLKRMNFRMKVFFSLHCVCIRWALFFFSFFFLM